MKHISITERGFGFEERELLSEDFDQILFVTDETFGSMGINDATEATRAIDSLLDNLALTISGVSKIPEEERSLEVIEDVALIKTIFGTNAVSMTLGPIASEMLDDEKLSDEERSRYEEMAAIASEAMALGRRAGRLSKSWSVDYGDSEKGED